MIHGDKMPELTKDEVDKEVKVITQRETVERMFITACVVLKRNAGDTWKPVEDMPIEIKSLLYTTISNATNLPRTTIRRIVNEYIKRANVTQIVDDTEKDTPK